MTSAGGSLDPAAGMSDDDMYMDDLSYDEADDDLSDEDAEFSEDGIYPEDDGMVIYDANSGTMVGNMEDEEDEG